MLQACPQVGVALREAGQLQVAQVLGSELIWERGSAQDLSSLGPAVNSTPCPSLILSPELSGPPCKVKDQRLPLKSHS